MAGLVRGAKALLDCSAHPACFLSMEILQNKSYPNATNNPMLKDLSERQVFLPAAEESRSSIEIGVALTISTSVPGRNCFMKRF